jgi:hypothetical protein
LLLPSVHNEASLVFFPEEPFQQTILHTFHIYLTDRWPVARQRRAIHADGPPYDDKRDS